MSKRLQNSRSRDSIALVRKARGLLAVAGACAFDRIFLEASGGSYLLCPSDRVGKGGYGRPTNSPSVIRSGDLAASDARAVISALASPLRFASDSLDDMDPDHTERSLAGLGGSSYTRGLVEKYGDPGHMAVWSYLELASFGGVISLYKYYVFERQAMKDEEAVKGLLFPTKALRNAAAHNGNILSALGSKLRKPVGSISRMAVEELGIDRELVSLTKRAPIVHDFTALTLCYIHLVKSEDARRDAAEKLRALRRRFMAHRDYFSKQGELIFVRAGPPGGTALVFRPILGSRLETATIR